MSVRRLVAALAIVMALLVAPLGVSLPARAATAKVVALTLQSQTPWVGKGGTFEVRIAAPPNIATDPNDLEFAISVHPTSPSRSAFQRTLTARATTAPLAVITTPLAEAVRDETGAVTLDVGVQDPTVPRDRTRVGLRGAGVYPVTVELRSVGGAVHARLLTHMVFVPETPTGPRLAVGTVVPVRAPLALQADGSDKLSVGDVNNLGAVATTLATLPAVGVFLAPSPETLAALVRGERDEDADALTALRTIATARPVIQSPFLPTQAPQTTMDDRAMSLDRGVAITTTAFGSAPDAGVGVITDPTDDRLLSDTGARLFIGDKVLTPVTQRVTTAEPIAVRRATSKTATTYALIADTALGAHLTNKAPAVLAAHQLLADLATIYFDSPGRFRSVVVVPPSDWKTDPAVLAPLLAGIESSPILEAASADRLFQTATKSTVPKVRVIQSPPTAASPPAGFETLRRTINSLATIMGEDTAQSFRDRFLIASSAQFSEARRRDYIDGLRDAIQEEREKFRLPTGGSITLTARKGAIPVTVRSTADYPAEVILQLASDRLKFPGGNTRRLTLTRHDTTQRFDIESLGSGTFPLRILLKSPDGRVVLGETRVTIRSTNASGVGIALSVGAGLFLLIWWYRHSARRRRHLAAQA